MAAIGASPIAKTLAVAYILFKVIAVRFALVSFPVIIRLLVRAENVIDGVTLLAAFRMAYNLVGVFVLVPVIGWFTRFLEIALGTLRLAHRSAMLGKVATGELIADEAIARVDAVTRLEALERHAWRSAATAGRDK